MHRAFTVREAGLLSQQRRLVVSVQKRLTVPWNRISKNYLADYDDNEDIASTDDGNGNASRTVDVVNAPVERAELSDALQNEIFESFGLRNGVHDVICFQYPHIACYVVYNPPNSASTIGDVIKFDAVYSSPLNAYLIAWPQRVQFALSYQYKLVNSKYLIEMRVAGDESLPLGYFHAQDEHLGMVYDRHAILAPALLHASRNAVFDVAVSDIGPSRFCRLTIENAIGYTQKLLESCHNIQHKTLKDLEGVMIGWEQVFVREYPVLNFRFNDFSTRNWEDLKTGTWIKFTAVIDGGLPKFVIQEWSAISGGVTESIDYVFIDEDFKESKGTVKDHVYRRVMEARRERKELLDAAEEDVRKLTLSDAHW
ncbi:unnamed protein product [Anisakis simplex]|uniref:Tudor domain-containing protein n=1 Tax=Anisakis simplex TaxID=6269 RepID=A0A0M3K3T1_ANISI|nr:unnamed protein product [Anisakis simplex]